ncbi:hypothetical protein HZC21_04960 [Candidatus Peregrinibacteria bacterium]|nr:hypothetical protein [Candidatus Peregrinibacteria bacterium]
MKSSTKIIIGVVVVALIGAGVYFGNTGLQKGSLTKRVVPCGNTWAKVFEEKIAGDGTSNVVTPLEEDQLLNMINAGCSFKASRQGKLALPEEKGFALKSFECTNVSYLYTNFKSSFMGSFSCSSGEKEDTMGALPSLDLYFAADGKVSSFHPSISKNDMYEYTFKFFAKK